MYVRFRKEMTTKLWCSKFREFVQLGRWECASHAGYSFTLVQAMLEQPALQFKILKACNTYVFPYQTSSDVCSLK